MFGNLINVARCTLMLMAVLVQGAMAQPLTLTVQTDRSAYSQSQTMHLTIRIRNISSSAVDIPKLDDATVKKYLSVLIQTPTGVSVFFISNRLSEPAASIAQECQKLNPGQEIEIRQDRNESGYGFLGYLDPANARTLQHLSGNFVVEARFSVVPATLPASNCGAPFLGTVSSTETSPASVSVVREDVTSDGAVDCNDVVIVRNTLGKKCGQNGFSQAADINRDCVVDVRDLASVSQKLPAGTRCQ